MTGNSSATLSTPPNPSVAIVVMGVSGCGKSVVAEASAAALHARFVEGDRLHPPENVARMASGEPLTDALRQGWLDAVGAQVAAAVASHRGVVAACSALKRSYRDRLRAWCGPVAFIHLVVDRETARRRVGGRKGHFMPSSLVDSQFADLELLQPDEAGIALDAMRPIDELVEAAALYAASLVKVRENPDAALDVR